MANCKRELVLVRGTDEISLDFGEYGVTEYNRRVAEVGGVGERVANVDEALKLVITGATDENIVNSIQKAGRWLIDARRRERIGTGDRVYIQYTPEKSDVTWQAEILKGRLEVLNREGFRSISGGGRIFRAGLGFTRRGAWEASSLVQLPLSNCNATRTTDNAPVYNANDLNGSSPTQRCNYVDIAAADIPGELPTPAYIVITNTYSDAARRLYVGHKVQGDPDSFTHILEAESATLGTGVSAVVCASCSNGNTANVVNIPATVRTLFTWTLSATQAAYVLSQWVRPLARFSTVPNNSTCKARLTLKDSTTGAIVAQSEYQALNNTDELQTLPALLLSPEQAGQVTPGAMQLLFEAKDSAATGDFSLDYLDLAPVEAGIGFRFYKPVDESLVSVPATTGTITDNQIDGSLFVESRQTVYVGFGGPIMLVPRRLNRLYFHRDNASGVAAVAATMGVKVYARQRALTI